MFLLFPVFSRVSDLCSWYYPTSCWSRLHRKPFLKVNWQLLNLFWLDYCSSVVTCERSSHVKTIILWYLLLGRIDYTIGLRMFIVPYIHLVIVVVTHFGGSRHWANPCTFRGIWRRIRCSGHPGERCPRVDPRIRSSKSGKRPSTAGNCAESCWISGRSVPAAFSCTRAFSIRWTKRWNKQQQRRYDCIERRETESCPSSSCPCVSFLLYSYQFFVVECLTPYVRYANVSFIRCQIEGLFFFRN